MHACTKVGINEGKRDRRGEKKKDDSIEIGADLFNLGTGRPPELFAERSLTLIYTLIHFHDEPFSLHSSFSPTRTRTQSLSLSLSGSLWLQLDAALLPRCASAKIYEFRGHVFNVSVKQSWFANKGFKRLEETKAFGHGGHAGVVVREL